jgi:hypothetical protein
VSEKKSAKEGTSRAAEASDSMRDNALHTVDEIARIQPQIAHSVTNLQQDTLETSKNIIRTTFEAQKQIATGLNIPLSSQVSEQAAMYSNELTDYAARATVVYNQFVINALNAAQENATIVGRAFDAVTEWNAKVLNTWISLWTARNQQ